MTCASLKDVFGVPGSIFLVSSCLKVFVKFICGNVWSTLGGLVGLVTSVW